MTDGDTDLQKLRTELRAMRRGDLLIIAERAIELVPRAKLKALLGDYVRIDDVTGERLPPVPLLKEVQKFHTESLGGRYFESFSVNSRNCMEYSKGTEAFMSEFGRLIKQCVSVVDSEPPSELRQMFELLFELLRHIDEGYEDVIFFADEGGSWQLPIDWQTVLAAYFKCLAESASAEEFSTTVDRTIKDFAEYERPQHLKSASKVANAAQRAVLDTLTAARG